MYKILLSRIADHLSSTSLSGILLLYYLLGDGSALDPFLPINGKPLACFLLVSFMFLLELIIKSNKKFTAKLCNISREIEVNAIKGTIAGLHRMHLHSTENTIVDDATIREIHDTYDKMLKIGLNSYHKQKMEFLIANIDLTKQRVGL